MFAIAAGAGVMFAPLPAAAHDAITLFGVAVTGFPAAMLHPFLTPDQALLLVAIALVIGRMESRAFFSVAAAFVAGLLAARATLFAITWMTAFWYAPLVATLIGGALAAIFRRIDTRLGLVAVFVFGFVLSTGLVPDEPTPRGLMIALAGAVVSGLAVMAIVGLPLTKVTSRWGGVLIRVAGAWLMAVAVINLALVIEMLSKQG